MSIKYTQQELEEIRKDLPTFQLSKKEALTYAAKMGATDSLRGLKQMGAKVFGLDDTLEELKSRDKKLQAILNSEEYGNAAMGTFLSSAVIADPIGWIPIVGTAKKAKYITDLAKYGAMAGGFHSGIGYVSEDEPGLIGEKQTRLENTLIGVGAGGALGAIGGSAANAIQKARGKDPIYGLTKKVKVPEEAIEKQKQLTEVKPKAKQEEEVIEAIVDENLDPKTKNPVLRFYQDIAGNTIKNAVFNNAGTSLAGFTTALGSYNSIDDPEATFQEKITTAALLGLSTAAGVNAVGRIKLGNELVSEKIGRLFIDDYGLLPEYKLLKKEMQVTQNSLGAKFLALSNEAAKKLNDEERKIFYNFMTGDIDSVDEMSEAGLKITKEARDLIDEVGQMYVDAGLLSEKVFNKNKATYLHRSYLKMLENPKEHTKFVKGARQITVIGENLRPRGDVKVFKSKVEYRKQAQKLKEEGYEILEQKGSLEPTKKVKGKKKKAEEKFEIKLRRDYTKQERRELGEIEDLAFAIAETGRLMSSDLAKTRFFNKLAENKNFVSTEELENFVQVPNTKVAGTSINKYGNLAEHIDKNGVKQSAKYIHKDVFNDITRMYKLQEPGTLDDAVKAFDTMQRTWKLSKTAWNPATHFNNTISNFLLLDFADTNKSMLVRAAAEMRKGDKSELFKLGKEFGIFDSDIISQELGSARNARGNEVLQSLQKTASLDNVTEGVKHSTRIKGWANKVYDKTLGRMEKAYQLEDQVFRLAVFIDRLDKGFDVTKASSEAKKWFIDYDINAPAIDFMKRTFTPFISYTYRVVPLLAEAAILRPHKFAKWTAIGYGLNEIGKQLEGGNEELERVTMREELSKKLYSVPFMPPRMIKLGWKSEAGDSQYLDVQRLIPGGDIFEQREGEGFKFPYIPAPLQPGGLLVDIPLLVGTRQNPFTGQDIEGLGVGNDEIALGKAVLKSLLPNFPGIPGAYSTEKINQAFALQEGNPDVKVSPYSVQYSPLEAIAYGFGIKLRPQNVSANKQLKAVDFRGEMKPIQDAYSKAKRNLAQGKINREEFDEQTAELSKAMLKLAAEWQLYERKVRQAEMRKQKAIGGLIEGEDNVPFTKENPAERVNPFTGIPYKQADLTEGGVLAGLLRNRMDRVSLQSGGELSDDEVMRDFILKAEDINLYNDYKAGNLEKTVKAHTGSKRYKDLHGKPDKETLAGVTGSGVSETTVEDAVDNVLQKALNETQQEYNRLVPEDIQNNRSINDQRALFSLLFNVGATKLQNSNALKAFREGRMSDFYKEGFDRDFGFTKVTGSDGEKRKDIGLVNRRKAELKLAQGSLESPMKIEEVVLPTRVSLKERLAKRAENA